MDDVRQRGFTLIELLVVLVIIGIVISFAMLSLGDGGKRDRLMEESKRLAALIELAGDQAVMEGREWGLRIAPDGYLFMVLQDGKWREVANDHLFKARQLANGFTLDLRMDDVAVSLTPPDKDSTDKIRDKSVEPQVFLMSSAERTPFQIVMSAPDGDPAMVIEAPPLGALVLHEKQKP